jgi:hypothetical protein
MEDAMKKKQLERYIAITAFAAGLMMGLFLLVSLLNGGITAQDFEVVQDPAAYSRQMLAAETPLRLILTLDNLFVLFYTTAFIFLAMRLGKKRNRLLVMVGLLALLVTAYLDLHENHTMLMQIVSLKAGIPLEVHDLQSRMVTSQLKFHSSYLSFFLFAFVMPKKTMIEKFLKYSLWFAFPPLGILVYTFPSPVWDWGRYLFMLSGLWLVAWVFWTRFQAREKKKGQEEIEK